MAMGHKHRAYGVHRDPQEVTGAHIQHRVELDLPGHNPLHTHLGAFRLVGHPDQEEYHHHNQHQLGYPLGEERPLVSHHACPLDRQPHMRATDQDFVDQQHMDRHRLLQVRDSRFEHMDLLQSYLDLDFDDRWCYRCSSESLRLHTYLRDLLSMEEAIGTYVVPVRDMGRNTRRLRKGHHSTALLRLATVGRHMDPG